MNIRLSGVFACLLSLAASAATVSEDMAAKAVRNWRSRKGQLGMTLGKNVAETRRVERGGAAFHVVRFEGGGFAVTPTDTAVRPVMLFSDGDDFEVDDANPALALLVEELSARAATPKRLTLSAASVTTNAAESAWAELLADTSGISTMSRKTTIDDVRVGPLVTTQWVQSHDSWGRNCYNYYTPNHYPCGCVATSAAQLMRFFAFPKASVSPFTRTCKVDGTATNLTAQAGTYDWASMPDLPGYYAPEAQRQAIGKLTSDAGIALGMAYASGGSSSSTMMIQYALATHFGYPKFPVGLIPNSGYTSGVDDSCGEVLRANFDAKLPVAIGLTGHSIIGDGYGYIGTTLYYHLNLGWGASWSVWYAPPDDLKEASSGFKGFHSVCHNVYTNAAMSGLVIASGRVTYAGGGPAEGVTVWAENVSGSAVTTDEHGIYALFVKPGTYTVHARKYLKDGTGRDVGEYGGSTTAKPLKCYSVTAKANGNYGYSGTPRIEGNDAGCDITLALDVYKPEATVAFAGEATLGEDFGSMTVPVGIQVSDFGLDCSSATLSVTLSSGGYLLATKTFSVSDFAYHEYAVTFDGLTPGTCYDVEAKAVFGTAAAATASSEVTAARQATYEKPLSAVLASSEIVVGLRIDDFSVFRLLEPVSEGSCLTAVWHEDDSGEFAVWDGAAWRKTGVAAELNATNVLSILQDKSGARRYRVLKGDDWVDLAPVADVPDEVSEIAVSGPGTIVSMKGLAMNANRIACADGSAEYADLSAAIAAGETRTLTPLWATKGVVPDDAALTVLTVLDPNGLLRLTGGNLLKATTGADGSKTYCYGTMDKAKVEASDYMKATYALGVSQPIQATSKVRLGDVAAADGALGFTVSVDGEPVTRERVKEFVRVADGLAGGDAAWRTPTDGEISADGGRVTVAPDGKDRAFMKVVLPKD